jgi:hypothetical protein
MKTLHLINRKRPCKIGEDMRNSGRLLGYVTKITRVYGKAWNWDVIIEPVGK